MAFIIMIACIIYFILIAWTWQSLGFMEKGKKVAFILIGVIAVYVVTLIVFQMAKGEIIYENIKMQSDVQKVLVGIFTGLNGIVIMPQMAKTLNKGKEEQVQKEDLVKRMIVVMFVFILCLFFEIGYMKSIQEGILKVYYTMK